jgi:hypothetical protein
VLVAGIYPGLGIPEIASFSTGFSCGIIILAHLIFFKLSCINGSTGFNTYHTEADEILFDQLILAALRKKSSIKTPTQNIIFLVLIGWLIATIAQFISPAILGSGKALMQTVLFTDKKSISIDTVLWRVAGPVLAFVTGGAGGVFAPSLAAGAGFGTGI